MHSSVPGWTFVTQITVMHKLPRHNQKGIDIVRWVYRMISAWVTDVCVLATLLLLIAFTFMFKVLQIYLHILKNPNKPKNQRNIMSLFLPSPPNKSFFFSIESNLGSWWTVELTNLWVLKHIQAVSSWFREEPTLCLEGLSITSCTISSVVNWEPD